ncbi:MAG: hypothetical protein ABH868_00850 [bacterium]
MIKIYRWVIYSGWATFVFLAATAVIGITRLNFALHKLFGILTFVAAVVHVALAIYKSRLMKRS